MVMPTWKEFSPRSRVAAAVTALLNERKVVLRHVLPSGERVEVAHAGAAKLMWLVVWTGGSDQEWPDGFEESVLARVQMDTNRQLTWLFLDERCFDWVRLIQDKWGLEAKLDTGRLA